MKLAVIGAGWAGLAAASELTHHGHNVWLFESSRTVGGRARRVEGTPLGLIDNGQHLLIGAYSQALSLMARDVPAAHRATSLKRLPLWLGTADGQFELKSDKAYPQRWRASIALWTAKGLGLSDKWRATRFLQRLSRQQNQPAPDQTVCRWLIAEGQTETLRRWLWDPLCLASMNTAAEEASATLFARVLRDSLINSDSHATDLLLPATDLTDLWPSHVAQRLTCRLGHTVGSVDPTEHSIRIDGEPFEAAVIATPPWSIARLFSPVNQARIATLLRAAGALSYRPIATCYVELEHPLTLPQPMLMMSPDREAGTLGQWAFDHQAIRGGDRSVLAFVISDALGLPELSDEALGQGLLTQLLNELSKRNASPPERTRLVRAYSIREKRATFAALPSLERPDNGTPWRRLTVAGDWTDTGYPAVLEGAVRSGLAAARLLESNMRQH